MILVPEDILIRIVALSAWGLPVCTDQTAFGACVRIQAVVNRSEHHVSEQCVNVHETDLDVGFTTELVSQSQKGSFEIQRQPFEGIRG